MTDFIQLLLWCITKCGGLENYFTFTLLFYFLQPCSSYAVLDIQFLQVNCIFPSLSIFRVLYILMWFSKATFTCGCCGVHSAELIQPA